MLGLVGAFTDWFLIILAFFVYTAASSEAQQTTIKAAFEGVIVGDVMTNKEGLKTVTEDTSISDLVNRMFNERPTGYPVVRNDDLVGMVTLEDAADIDEIEQDASRVEDVRSTDTQTVTPDADAMEVFQRMQQHSVGRLPVVDDTGTRELSLELSLERI